MFRTYISELHFSNFSQCTNDFPAYLIGNVQLGQRHVRRAEKGVFRHGHDDESASPSHLGL